jgi:formylglycine-generating enzyme required for sulfatase activity
MLDVSEEVLTLTGRKQRPNIDVSIRPRGCLAPECGALAEPTLPGPVDPDAAVRRDYEFAERAGTREAWDAFLARHPRGYFADLARVQRGKLAVVAPPARPATPPAPVRPAVGVVPLVSGLPLSPERERALQPKDSFKECDACPEMVVVPAGTFIMGSPTDEKNRSENEGPQHRVIFSRQFAVGKFAVTFAEWDACVAGGGCSPITRDSGWGRDRRPVINASWEDAHAYSVWLSRKTGRTYRLLNEAEREYVARAGTTTAYWTGPSISTAWANYNGTSTAGEFRQKTMPVDTFPPNQWGFHDVHGNVWEWVADCWNESHRGAPPEGSTRTTGDCSRRVIRGGSWNDDANSLRAALRHSYAPAFRLGNLGFRVARTLSP